MTVLRDVLRADAARLVRVSTSVLDRTRKRVKGLSPLELYLAESKGAAEDEETIGTGLAGDDLIRQIHVNITFHMRITRFQYQSAIHRRLLLALLPQIYRADWDHHQTKILKYYELDHHRPYVLCSAPRREGKTWTLTMLVAALMDLVPMTIVVFSISQRVSSMFMDKVKDFYLRLPGAAARVAKDNQENFIVSPSGRVSDPAACHLMCLPNSERSRGISPHWLVFEEAEFMDDEVQKNVGGPTLMMRGTCMTAISSPGQDKNNFIRQLMEREKRKPDSLYDVQGSVCAFRWQPSACWLTVGACACARRTTTHVRRVRRGQTHGM